MRMLWKIWSLTALVGLTLTFMSTRPAPAPPAKIQWLSIEEAAAQAPVTGKKIMVDLYTDWCGWCKRMDANTYTDPELVAYINQHYLPVKFDAEQKADVVVGGQTFSYLPNVGRRGVHELAMKMMQGRPSYPNTVILDSNLAMLTNVPGYMGPDELGMILRFLGEDIYKHTSWDSYQAQQKAQNAQR